MLGVDLSNYGASPWSASMGYLDMTEDVRDRVQRVVETDALAAEWSPDLRFLVRAEIGEQKAQLARLQVAGLAGRPACSNSLPVVALPCSK